MVWRFASGRRLTLLAGVLCFAAAPAVWGCGSAGKTADAIAPPPSVSERTEGVSVKAGRVRLSIDSPKQGERQKVAGGVAVIFLNGRGAPGGQVRLGAQGCSRGCEQVVSASADGRWEGRLIVPAKGRGAVTIRATYGDGSGGTKVKLGLGGRWQTPRAGSTRRRQFVMIGDSLAAGMESALPAALESWKVTVDGRIGRPLAEGMSILRDTNLPDAGSSVLAISLFTNDTPTNIAGLRAGVLAALNRVGARGCVVWATIVAPPIDGVSYDAANNELRRLAGRLENLRIVRWDSLARRNPQLLEPDETHPTAEGYARLAALYARAARSCG